MNISSDQYHNGLGLFRQALNDPSLELEWIWKPIHPEINTPSRRIPKYLSTSPITKIRSHSSRLSRNSRHPL